MKRFLLSSLIGILTFLLGLTVALPFRADRSIGIVVPHLSGNAANPPTLRPETDGRPLPAHAVLIDADGNLYCIVGQTPE